VSVVDLSGRPAGGAVSVSEDSHRADLQSVGQSAGSARATPAGDLTALSSIGASVRGSQVGVADVSVGRDARGPPDGCDVVRVTLSSTARVVRMPCLAVEGSQLARPAAGRCTISGTNEKRIARRCSSHAVTGSDTLHAADYGGTARVAVVNSERRLPWVVSNVRVATADNPGSDLLAGS